MLDTLLRALYALRVVTPDRVVPSDHQLQINRVTWRRFRRAILSFFGSEVGGKGKLLFAALILFLLMISGLNVVNSYVGRDFMTALAERNTRGFVREAIFFVMVLGALTVVAAVYRFSEERLGLLWREWMTQQLITAYLQHPTYYRLNDHLLANGEIANPDQRIAEDVRSFTTSTLSFVLLLLNGTATAIAFSGVMWSISPMLFGIAVAYALAGSFITIRLGMPLVGLNYGQLDKEANFRADLVHVREHGEVVALLHHEARIAQRLRQRLNDLTANFRRIIGVNFQLGLFTTWYNYLIQIIPALIVAPLFFRGEVEFGVITQSAMAFAQLLGAFSLIVTQFQSLSSYTAVMARLDSLGGALEQARSGAKAWCPHGRSPGECPACHQHPTLVPDAPAIRVCEADDRISYEGLSLRSARDDRVVIDKLSITIPCGTCVQVRGDAAARIALFRVTAGIWDVGDGQIIRPGLGRIMFLPERPYLPPGTLRELLLPPTRTDPLRDDEIDHLLQTLWLESALARAGGLDAEHDWKGILSLGEQHLMGIARVLIATPRFVFLDRPQTALTVEQLDAILHMFRERSITYVTISDENERTDRYDATLELSGDGGWAWKGTPRPEKTAAAADCGGPSAA